MYIARRSTQQKKIPPILIEITFYRKSIQQCLWPLGSQPPYLCPIYQKLFMNFQIQKKFHIMWGLYVPKGITNWWHVRRHGIWINFYSTIPSQEGRGAVLFLGRELNRNLCDTLLPGLFTWPSATTTTTTTIPK